MSVKEIDASEFNRTLYSQRQTDPDRWRNLDHTYGLQNPIRAQMASCLIPEGNSVLDLGAASLILKKFLYPSCKYTPSDYLDRGPGTIVCDLNKAQFPSGTYDFVVTLGVIEYIHDVEWLFDRIREAGKNYIVTYNLIGEDHENDASILSQRIEEHGWRNAFSYRQLASKLEKSGWRVKKLIEGGNIYIGGAMMLCARL